MRLIAVQLLFPSKGYSPLVDPVALVQDVIRVYFVNAKASILMVNAV